MTETKFIKGQLVQFGGNVGHNYLGGIKVEIVGILQNNPWGRIYIVDSDELRHNFPEHGSVFIVPEEYLKSC